jgi:hypothetical protein
MVEAVSVSKREAAFRAKKSHREVAFQGSSVKKNVVGRLLKMLHRRLVVIPFFPHPLL